MGNDPQKSNSFLQRGASMRALWSDRQNCSHNVSQKVNRIRRVSDPREIRRVSPNEGRKRAIDLGGGGVQKPLLGEGALSALFPLPRLFCCSLREASTVTSI